MKVLTTALIVLWAATCGALADDRPMEYQDNQYQFAFQFPQSWKLQSTPAGNEYGEVRVVVKHPTRAVYAEVIVTKVTDVVTREQYEANPNRDGLVKALMQFTVEQVYKKTSRDVGAERMLVTDEQLVPSNAGIEFYISTVLLKTDLPMVVFGIHIVPFGKPYVLAFIVVTSVDKSATADNEALTKMLNSFHVTGEKPLE
jgi:hypothetical protein